jgi:outer membrane protein
MPSGGFLPPQAPDWTVTLGAEGRLEPKFQGADNDVLRPYPLFDLRRVGTPERFHAPRDSAGIALFETGTFQAGAVGALRTPRSESNDPALQGLGRVGWTVEVGGFAEYWAVPWLRLRGEVRQGIGGHHGVVSDLMTDGVFAVTPQFTISGGPRASLATKDATSPYFSIDAMQSLASGLPTFDAKGGVHSLGVGGQARYRWLPELATHAFVEYERLMGDAANSPLVVQRGDANQLTVGVGVTRSFDIKSFW